MTSKQRLARSACDFAPTASKHIAKIGRYATENDPAMATRHFGVP